MLKELLDSIDNMQDEMVNALANICRIPAIAPESGGDGEAKKAHYIVDMCKALGFKNIEVVEAPDRRVSAGYRPNIIVTVKGSNSQLPEVTQPTEERLPPLWIVSHADVVPVGDITLWNSEPHNPIVKDGKLIGRGVEDNGQSLIASIFATKAIVDAGIQPKRDVKLCFVADEEVGSKFGIKYLVQQGLFSKDDLILVPDFGDPEGKVIEVVEKGHLQIKIVTKGKQVHASRPHKGINAMVAASRFIDRITTALYEKYNQEDVMFYPPTSTFEATKREANVPNINTVPGEDIFYMDCRILPLHDLEEIVETMKGVATKVGIETGARIELQEVRLTPAPPATPIDSDIVQNLQKAIGQVYGFEAKPIGIGGGTCAAIFRKNGYPAAVWSTNQETAHEPNECSKIENLVADAKVFALLALM